MAFSAIPLLRTAMAPRSTEAAVVKRAAEVAAIEAPTPPRRDLHSGNLASRSDSRMTPSATIRRRCARRGLRPRGRRRGRQSRRTAVDYQLGQTRSSTRLHPPRPEAISLAAAPARGRPRRRAPPCAVGLRALEARLGLTSSDVGRVTSRRSPSRRRLAPVSDGRSLRAAPRAVTATRRRATKASSAVIVARRRERGQSDCGEEIADGEVTSDQRGRLARSGRDAPDRGAPANGSVRYRADPPGEARREVARDLWPPDVSAGIAGVGEYRHLAGRRSPAPADSAGGTRIPWGGSRGSARRPRG